jgi:hypothetical protein
LIKEESTSELLRFTICHILNQVGIDKIYRYLERERQKKARGNNQQPLILSTTTCTRLDADDYMGISCYRLSN